MQLAREAGFQSPRLEDKTDYFMLDRFAALVAAHEREQCALVCDMHQEGGIGGWKHNTPMDCAVAIRARGELAKMAKPSNIT